MRLFRNMLYGVLTMLLAFLLFMNNASSKEKLDTFRLHTDFPYLNSDDIMFLDVFYSADSLFSGMLEVQYFQYNNNGDSLLVLHRQNAKTVFKKGVGKVRINFSKTDSNTSYAQKSYEILKRTGRVPPGLYKIYLSLKDSSRIYTTVYMEDVDTMLSAKSPVRQDINHSLMAPSKSFFGRLLKSKADKVTSSGAGNALSNAKTKVDKATKKRGLTSVHSEKNGKSYIDLYYQDWFAGRYEADSKMPLSNQVRQQEDLGNTNNLNSLTNNDLGHPSLFSQNKSLDKQKKDQDEYHGEIGITTNISTGQEQYSGVDNNYYEVRGRSELPINKIPVEVEGLYTSQDARRQIKSSYFRVHYDIEKVKSALEQNVKSYNTKYSETKSKSIGMEQVYGSALNSLEGQKARLQNEIASQTDTKNLKPTDAGLADSKEVTMDTTEKQQFEEKRRKVDELDKKIERYKILLAQEKNTNYFDSAIVFRKTKAITSHDMSYKQLAKRSSELLPDGKAKSFMTGITTMDAGMFPKSESKYTMSGQMMKGVDFGYDLGFCEAGLTAGKTQYVGRDGSLDQYTCYSGKASFKLVKGQKMSFIYYGYSPDRTIFAGNDFYKNVNISAPSFFQPVHVLSGNYAGAISKYLTFSSEVATSIRQSEKMNIPVIPQSEKMAYHINMEGNVPNTPVTLEGAYDKTGKGFENNTLPISLSGTEQYKATGRADLFQAFLTLGVEYNLLRQANFASRGSNTKWGFDVKTNSKRYPNFALSYKPFTTFHSYTDTLNVPQRPLIGSVWTGKASYQIRKHKRSLRFQCLYNSTMTTMDTTNYGSKLMQFTTIYANHVLTTSITAGQMALSGTNLATLPTPTPNKTSFLTLMGSYAFGKKLSITGGQDFGAAVFGLCRYSVNGGFVYRFEKIPFTMRINARFNDYKLNPVDGWKRIYNGSIDVAYRFKMKNLRNNN
jgi:hypothetical protein